MMKTYIVELTDDQAMKLASAQNTETSAGANVFNQIMRQFHEVVEREVVEWHKPNIEDQFMMDLPYREGATVLFRMKNGEFRKETVIIDYDKLGRAKHRFKDWKEVDAWAYLPEWGK